MFDRELFLRPMANSHSKEMGKGLTRNNPTESVVAALRQIVDVERQLRDNKGCDKVYFLNTTFDERRWKKEAPFTVQAANVISSLWHGYPAAANNELLYHFGRSLVLLSPHVFRSVISFDFNLYRNYTRFYPYAFRNHALNGSVHVFDIAKEVVDATD